MTSMHTVAELMKPYGGLPPVALCLSTAENLRDYGTNAHAKRVSRMVENICRELDVASEERGSILGASLLHDIGKFAIPLDVILKAAPLTQEEVALLKTHSARGHQVLSAAGDVFLQMAADIAWCHHEHYDGTGYPRGLSGGEIPLGARILSICDVYDALRQDRPYRRGMPHSKAVDVIINGDGRTSPKHFAPDVLMAFKKKVPHLKAIYESGL